MAMGCNTCNNIDSPCCRLCKYGRFGGKGNNYTSISTQYKSGIYETVYGNACEYHKGNKSGYDMDMAERIPIVMINFRKYIRDID